MSPVKFLFDECIGEPMMRKLDDFVAAHPEQVEFRHILAFQREGEPDDEWIPKRASEGWILITTDLGRGGLSGRGAKNKLPLACRQHGMTHIGLGPAIHRMKQFDKAKAILSVWNDILRLVPSAPAGSRFVISKGAKHARLEKRS